MDEMWTSGQGSPAELPAAVPQAAAQAAAETPPTSPERDPGAIAAQQTQPGDAISSADPSDADAETPWHQPPNLRYAAEMLEADDKRERRIWGNPGR